ncbi:nucleosome binding protein [Pelomyxa schiedti]|nr:nucleosome binding protein [Pelomyxa schiedti]
MSDEESNASGEDSNEEETTTTTTTTAPPPATKPKSTPTKPAKGVISGTSKSAAKTTKTTAAPAAAAAAKTKATPSRKRGPSAPAEWYETSSSSSEEESADSASDSDAEEEPVKPVKKTKRTKDPAAPKGPRSAYLYFSNERGRTLREEMKAKNPKLDSKEVMVELGRLWREMTTEEKERFEELAKRDKVRWEKEMKKYVPAKDEDESSGSDAPAARRTKRSKIVPGQPSGRKSAYMCYQAEIMSEVKAELKAKPDFKSQDLLKEIGHRWKTLPADQKQKYDEAAAQDKIRYEKEMKAWKKNKV